MVGRAAAKLHRRVGAGVDIIRRVDRVRLRLDLSYRDLAFILHSQPGLPAYEQFPTGSTTAPDYFAAVGADRNWSDWLTLGVIAGIERPSTLTSPQGIPGAGPDATAVIRSNNVDTLITILPAGARAASQVAIKGTAKVDFARIFSAVVELFYSHDGNQTRYERACADPQMCPLQYVFGQFHQLGLNATLQARF